MSSSTTNVTNVTLCGAIKRYHNAMSSVHQRDLFEASEIVQSRIDTDGLDTVCAAAFMRYQDEDPEGATELLHFANVTFPASREAGRQHFLDTYVARLAIQHTAADLALFRNELSLGLTA